MLIDLRRFEIVFIGVAVLLGQIIVSFIILENSVNDENWAFIVSILALVEILIQQVTLSRWHVPVSDFRRLFILMHYLFFWGRIFIYGFFPDIDVFWDLLRRFDNHTLLRMGLYSVCAVQSLYIGLFFTGQENDIGHIDTPCMSLRTIGILCLAIGIPCELITDYTRVQSTYYAGTYNGLEIRIGLIDDISILFLAGIILLVCSNTIKKRSIKLILTVSILYYFIVMIFSGDRRYQITAIICLFLLLISRTNHLTNINGFTLLVIGLAGLITLNVLYIIRENRVSNLQNVIGEVFNNPLRLISLNVFYETLAEFGISFFSLCNIGKNIPSKYSFQYGITFIYSLGALLPLGIMNNIRFFDYASFSTILNREEKLRVGATLIGDFYSNFGWLSCAILIFFGIILFNLLYKKSRFGNQWDEAKYYILFYAVLPTVRATFTQCIRPFVFGFIFPWLLLKLFSKKYK